MARIVLLVLLLVLSGCTTDDDPTVAAPGSPPGPLTTSSDGSGGEIPEVLAFTGETVQGDQFDGVSYAGGDLLVWFWAPW